MSTSENIRLIARSYFYNHSPPFCRFLQEELLSVTSESMCIPILPGKTRVRRLPTDTFVGEGSSPLLMLCSSTFGSENKKEIYLYGMLLIKAQNIKL